MTNIHSKNIDEIDVINEEKNKFDQKLKFKSHNKGYNLNLYYFHRIIGPELFHQIGSTIFSEETNKQIPKYMDVNMGEMNVSIENYYYYINIFEIESKWARGNKELLELVIFFDQEKLLEREISKEIKNLARNFVKKLKTNHKRYIAFYQDNSEKLKENREEITKEAESLKKDLTDFYMKINKSSLLETSTKNNKNIESNNFLPIFVKIESEIQKLLIKENFHMN